MGAFTIIYAMTKRYRVSELWRINVNECYSRVAKLETTEMMKGIK
jgi:hypothetical protein